MNDRPPPPMTLNDWRKLAIALLVAHGGTAELSAADWESLDPNRYAIVSWRENLRYAYGVRLVERFVGELPTAAD